MKRIKKLVAVSLIFAISTFLIPAEPVGASVIRRPGNIVTPMYIDIDTFYNYFDILPGGIASTTSTVFSGSADYILIVIFLEKQRPDGEFNRITSWSNYNPGPFVYCWGECNVSRGTYRIHSYCYTYINGVVTDYDSYISFTVTY